jgi:hypothetical protein
LDRADREESDIAEAKSVRLKEKIAGLRQQMQALKVMERRVQDAPDQQVSLTDPDLTRFRSLFFRLADPSQKREQPTVRRAPQSSLAAIVSTSLCWRARSDDGEHSGR